MGVAYIIPIRPSSWISGPLGSRGGDGKERQVRKGEGGRREMKGGEKNEASPVLAQTIDSATILCQISSLHNTTSF